VIEETAATAYSLPRARRLASPGKHPAVSSLPPVVAKIALLSASTTWQRALKISLGKHVL